ncbi:nuclear transport factor 2 family protein [Telluria aromaticivorans]|uniref:Nuclear transport factor 2 family protein n=1 Tax=Telluria aromaticivorans TaxID=2725995 RepID=A0A7Y2K2D3_9BURK|nr:nuclear transport factor 2 family protein [Telluria aromaticivorans]NNG25296.1 nuclear transport factor 2 family protein [Telluria aromaticivorans]
MDQRDSIEALIEAYFRGVYNGDTAILDALFDPHAQVYGEIDGQAYHKTVASYLEGVAARKSPKELGDPYRMQLLAVDTLGSIANVKLRSPMLGFNYHLYLTLRRIDGKWSIVNKTFVNLPPS